MTLIAWNGGPLFVNGAVGTEQSCCCDPPVCEWYQAAAPDVPGAADIQTYSYDDTIPPAPDFCDCPCTNGYCYGDPPAAGPTAPECYDPDNLCTTGSCCDEELVCYVRSVDFIATTACKPRAIVYQGALFDDHGTIEGQDRTVTLDDPCAVNDPPNPLPTKPLTSNEAFVPFVVDNGDGTVYLKLNVVAKNGGICGAYGVLSMTVEWFFE